MFLTGITLFVEKEVCMVIAVNPFNYSLAKNQLSNIRDKSSDALASNPAITLKKNENRPDHTIPADIAFKSLYIEKAINKKPITVAEKFAFERLTAFLDSISTDRAKAVREVLVKSCTKDNILGEGKLHVAFSIPGTEDFVLRVNKFKDICMGTLAEAPVLFEDINLGQLVANLNGSGADVQFMRRVKGNSQGAPFVLIQQAKKLDPSLVDKLPGQDEYVKNILEIADVPQITFNNFAGKIKMLRNGGYVFDIANPNNVMLYKAERGGLAVFNIVDDIYKIDDIQRMYKDRAWSGTFEDLVYPLMDLNAGRMYCKSSKDLVNNAELSKQVQKANGDIFKKCVKAAVNEGIPLNREKFDVAHLAEMTGLKEATINKIFDNWNRYIPHPMTQNNLW